MTFGEALEELKNGELVSRHGWNGSGQYIFLVRGIDIEDCIFYLSPVQDFDTCSDVLAIRTTSGVVQVGWLASQTDMLSSDWYLVKNIEQQKKVTFLKRI